MKILVEGLEFVGRHGVYEEERIAGRRFVVDVVAELGEEPGADRIEQTLDYRAIAALVLEICDGPSRRLVETLAAAIADEALARFPELVGVSIALRKFATGVPGEPRSVGVSLERRRGSA